MTYMAPPVHVFRVPMCPTPETLYGSATHLQHAVPTAVRYWTRPDLAFSVLPHMQQGSFL
jgi:hypothetical protein